MLRYILLFILIVPQLGFSEPIKIGVNTILTGSAAFWGEMSRKGLELGLEEENEAGGINGKKIELIYSDFGDLNYVAAANAAHKFVNLDRVNLIFSNIAEDTRVIYPIAAKAKIPVIAIAIGSETATLNNPGLFRTTTSDLTLWRKSVNFLKSKNLSQSCWAVMQSEYFLDISQSLEVYWKQIFGHPPFIQTFSLDDKNLGSLALKFKEKQCTAVLLMSWIGPAAEIIKKSTAINYKPQFIGPANVSDGKDFLDLAQGQAEGLIFGKFSSGNSEFVTKFTKKYGGLPERPAATSYDAIRLTAKVMREFGTTPAAIQKGLSETKNFSGASGNFSINSDGTRSDEEYQILLIKNEKAIPLQ